MVAEKRLRLVESHENLKQSNQGHKPTIAVKTKMRIRYIMRRPPKFESVAGLACPGAKEVSAYLSHTDKTAADHYIESSPAQNMLVNAALGESPTYQSIAAAMRGDLITVADLLGRPADQQIGGIPHGIPVSGIGACAAGQSLCTPTYSCPAWAIRTVRYDPLRTSASLRTMLLDTREAHSCERSSLLRCY